MADRPNILLIFTDQHRLSGVSAYGSTPCQTPNIDRLASEGVRFETAYTTCPVCSPARGTIMTGQYPHKHGICGNTGDLGNSIHELLDRPSLLSRRLQTGGYNLGYAGKWHLGTGGGKIYGVPTAGSLPKDVGFEGHNVPGYGSGGYKCKDFKKYLADNGYTDEMEVLQDPPVWGMGILKGPPEASVPYWVASDTIGLMDRFAEKDNPFFIWQNFWGPHSGYYIPREFYDMYKDVDIPEWPNYRWDSRGNAGPHHMKIHSRHEELNWDDWAMCVRHYYGLCTFIDQQIGRTIDHLDKTGQLKNTVILFSADHGETLGSHGGLIDKGWHHFEETHRVPMIAWFPPGFERNRRASGEVVQEWASLLDVYPTVLDIAGIDWDPDLVQGRSLMPLFEKKDVTWRDTVVTEFHGVNGVSTSMLTIRRGKWKYGWNSSNVDVLFNLEADPHEMTNLAEDPGSAEALQHMQEVLWDWMYVARYQGRVMYEMTRMKVQPTQVAYGMRGQTTNAIF